MKKVHETKMKSYVSSRYFHSKTTSSYYYVVGVTSLLLLQSFIFMNVQVVASDNNTTNDFDEEFNCIRKLQYITEQEKTFVQEQQLQQQQQQLLSTKLLQPIVNESSGSASNLDGTTTNNTFRTCVLCPNTIYEISVLTGYNDPLSIENSNVRIQCGHNDNTTDQKTNSTLETSTNNRGYQNQNCTFLGGLYQVDVNVDATILYYDENDTDHENVSQTHWFEPIQIEFIGIIFDSSKAFNVRIQTSTYNEYPTTTEIKTTVSSKQYHHAIKFIDCIFQNNHNTYMIIDAMNMDESNINTNFYGDSTDQTSTSSSLLFQQQSQDTTTWNDVEKMGGEGEQVPTNASHHNRSILQSINDDNPTTYSANNNNNNNKLHLLLQGCIFRVSVFHWLTGDETRIRREENTVFTKEAFIH